MKKNRLNFIVCIVLVACESEPSKKNLENLEDIQVVFYEQDKNKNSFIQLDELSINEDSQLNFRGYILDPFSAEKIEVSINGFMIKNELELFELKSKSSKNIEVFNCSINENGTIDCYFITNKEIKSPFSGQWSFSATRK